MKNSWWILVGCFLIPVLLMGCGEEKPKKKVEEPLLDLDSEKQRYQDNMKKVKARMIRVYEREIKVAKESNLPASTQLLEKELDLLINGPKAPSADLSKVLENLTSSLGQNANLNQKVTQTPPAGGSSGASSSNLGPLLGLLGQVQSMSKGNPEDMDMSKLDLSPLFNALGQAQGASGGQNGSGADMNNMMNLLGQVLNSSAGSSTGRGRSKGNDVFSMLQELNQSNYAVRQSEKRLRASQRRRSNSNMRKLLTSIHQHEANKGQETYPAPYNVKQGIRTMGRSDKGVYAIDNQMIEQNDAKNEFASFTYYKGRHPFDPTKGYYLFLGVDENGEPKKINDPKAKVLIEVYDWKTKGDKKIAVCYGDSRIEYIKAPETSPEETDILKLLSSN